MNKNKKLDWFADRKAVLEKLFLAFSSLLKEESEFTINSTKKELSKVKKPTK